MKTFALLMLCVLTAAASSGCRFDGGPGSRALDFDPFNWGTGEPVFSPSEGFGFVDGHPLDMRN